MLQDKGSSVNYGDVCFLNLYHDRNRRVIYYLELREISLRVAFIARVTSYFFHTSYELLFTEQAASYFYCTSYGLLFVTRVTSYFWHTSCELLFTARVTS